MTTPSVEKVSEEPWHLLSVLFSGDEGSEEGRGDFNTAFVWALGRFWRPKRERKSSQGICSWWSVHPKKLISIS